MAKSVFNATSPLGRQCVCNGLLATIGLAQMNLENNRSLPLVAAASDITHIDQFLRPSRNSCNAVEVVSKLFQNDESTTVPETATAS